MMTKEREQIWKECLDFEASRKPQGFHQTLSLEGGWCTNCGFFNRPEFKKETEMNDAEKIMWNALKKLPDFIAKPERRKFRLTKSDIGVWCYVCEKCVPMMPPTWK